MNALSEYLQERARKDGLSIRGFARRCDIAVETARRLLEGTIEPKEATLEKIADNLPAPLNKLRELAGGDPGRKRFAWPPEFDLLTDHERRLVMMVGHQFLRARGVTAGNSEQSEQTSVEAPVVDGGATVRVLHPTPSPRRRVKTAARKRPKSDVTQSDQDSLPFTHMD